jgi:hypothetical protein
MGGKEKKYNPISLFASCLLFIAALSGCGVSKSSFSPTKKYTPEQLQKDYGVYQNVLQEHHPGLYWYTSKDSMDYFFKQGRQQLNDSLTEAQFRKILAYVIAKVNCGHTTVRPSKAWNKYMDTLKGIKLFPLSVKVWGEHNSPVKETMLITSNLNRRDSILKRGTEVVAINGKNIDWLTDTLFHYISTDGYNTTHKYQSLSNRGFFGSLYTSVFGLSDKYTVDYKDADGSIKTITTPVYNPLADTVVGRGTRVFRSTAPPPSKQDLRRQRLSAARLLKIDSANHTAMMDLSTFSKGYGLKKFFRNSFKALRKNKIGHLIIDVRSNGGGSVTNSTNLSRYIATSSFKISDSLYAIRKKSPYGQYIQNNFWNKLFITLLTKKRKDGNYHFGYFERHYFKPKKNNHYDGKVYILTGGNSFSATTLFANALMKQDNVTVVGEETGGGAYGNSAWLIPDVSLPETGIRFRLPLFRLVTDTNIPKNGKGVQPEEFSVPTVELIRKNTDFKVEKAMELIKKEKEKK